jgi:mRNA (guanine-N7-)-methyltransferase
LLRNVSDRLKEGGWFIGTIPNANWIVKKIRNCEGLTFGNSVFSITFPQKRTFPPFGAQYTFSLLDAVKDVPEYLVHFPTLERLAAQVGLQLYKKWTFHELFCEKVKSDQALYRLLFHMEAVDEHGAISTDEWEAANIYLAFAFRKVGETQARSYPPLSEPETGMKIIPSAAPPPPTSGEEEGGNHKEGGHEDPGRYHPSHHDE